MAPMKPRSTAMCEKLLANTVIENFTIEPKPGSA
jgi:phosphoribosylformylglycinamidine (FGAM) synthase PurS component